MSAEADARDRPREFRPGPAGARRFFLEDDPAAHGLQLVELAEGRLIFGGNPRITDEGHPSDSSRRSVDRTLLLVMRK
jgi:hypothetical protein